MLALMRNSTSTFVGLSNNISELLLLLFVVVAVIIVIVIIIMIDIIIIIIIITIIINYTICYNYHCYRHYVLSRSG